jgi:rRNA maturation protein Nop10
MEISCPHCAGNVCEATPDPFRLPDEFDCPRCGRHVYLEVDEGDEGPVFTLYREPPWHDLYPPVRN